MQLTQYVAMRVGLTLSSIFGVTFSFEYLNKYSITHFNRSFIEQQWSLSAAFDIFIQMY